MKFALIAAVCLLNAGCCVSFKMSIDLTERFATQVEKEEAEIGRWLDRVYESDGLDTVALAKCYELGVDQVVIDSLWRE